MGGVALLVLLSVGAVMLYRSAPQSAAEVTTGALLAARPGAFEPNLARAEERLRAAASAPDDSSAVAALASAAELGWRARELAADPEETGRATAVWAEAMLGWAERLRAAGTGAGLRPDDNQLLRQALALTQSVGTVPLPPPLRQRTETLRARIERQLRPGPLEWLPPR